MRMPNKKILAYRLITNKFIFTHGVDVKSTKVYTKTVELEVVYGWFLFGSKQTYEVPAMLCCMGRWRKDPDVLLQLSASTIPEWYNLDRKLLERELQKLFSVTKRFAKELED